MKRIAFNLVSVHRRVNKTQIKMGIMGHHHRASAAGCADLMADGSKDIAQCFTFFLRHTFRVIEINTGKFQRGFFNHGAGKRINISTVSLFYLDIALSIHLQNHRGNFQQCVGARVKTTGFNVYYNG